MKNLTLVAPPDIPLAQDVPTDNLLNIFRLCTQMEQCCYENQGIGLSAVQVGIPWKLFIVFYEKENKFRYFLNCYYEGIGDKIQSLEGCLSLKNSDGKLRKFDVPRFSKIKLIGQELVISEFGLELKEINFEVSGLYANVYQHETDHHFQILISDFGREMEVWE